MIQTQTPGVANDPENHRFTGLPLPIGHRLPAVVVEVPETFERTQHRHACLVLMLMHLGGGKTRAAEQQHQGTDQAHQQTAHVHQKTVASNVRNPH